MFANRCEVRAVEGEVGVNTSRQGRSEAHTIRVLGIDPGLRRTGWGVIDVRGTRLSFVASGTIVPDDTLPLPARLAAIYEALTDVLTSWEPHEAAVEETFVNANPRATLKLGQARGIAVLVPSLAGMPVGEYAPNLVKKTVVGSGHGAKQQVGMMVKVLLPRSEVDGEDAADALAVAICHAQHRAAPVASSAKKRPMGPAAASHAAAPERTRVPSGRGSRVRAG